MLLRILTVEGWQYRHQHGIDDANNVYCLSSQDFEQVHSVSWISFFCKLCSTIYVSNSWEKFIWSWVILRNIGSFLAGFRWCQLFPGLPQWVLDGFRSFQVVSCFSKYINVLIKTVYRSAGVYHRNSVGRGELEK